MAQDWLELHRGEAPLVLCMPHTGTEIPEAIERRLVSPWLARKDADWRIEQLYDFAQDLDATIVRTRLSRTVIDLNRDPSGASLYPGQSTTGLCPTTTFDGEPLYRDGEAPTDADIQERRQRWFTPYHAAIAAETARLRRGHATVVLYDAHAIRSAIPRLFDGRLPHFNIGTNSSRSCDPALAAAVDAACADDGFERVLDGRFKGGWTTRHHGRPAEGLHAIQMELAFRGYLDEPADPGPDNWPPAWDKTRAGPMRGILARVLDACIAFARETR